MIRQRPALLIERWTRARDHMWAWKSGQCQQCGRRTHWIELGFERPLCRGKCTRAADAEYWVIQHVAVLLEFEDEEIHD